MLLTLKDTLLKATFDQVAMKTTRKVKVGTKSHKITTPFPSPQDWRDVWIYFLMLDRFNRADGKLPVSMPHDKPFGEFQGGTFNGVRDRLKYIKDLGAGAIWLSPVLKNRQSDRGTFHGYGIQDFLQPEPRFASAPGKEDDELRALVDEAHAVGLYVIFDIVLNHAGDVFGYKDFGHSAPGSPKIRPIEWRDGSGQARSDFPSIEDIPVTQRNPDALIWPEELQRNSFFRRKGKGAEEGGDFESLKEFVTEVREGRTFPVRNALILAYQYAIARYDVDGFRIDTLKYIERDFAQTFGNAMREYSQSIGKKNFFTYGEVFDGEERIAEFIGRNTSDAGDMVGVDAALDFPLFFRLPSVAKGFAPPTELIDVFRRRKEVERDILSSHGEAGRFFVTFLDNHDMKERFRGANTDGPDEFDPQVILGITVLFGLQGIPCLYYGTEQGLHGRGNSDKFVREALWGKPNAFDSNHLFYKTIRRLSEIRDTQPALRYGRLYFRPISGDGIHFGASPFAPGVLAFSRILNNIEVLVVANTSTQVGFQGEVLIDWSINNDGEQFHVLNDAGASAPGPVESRSDLEINEVDGRLTTGPARMIRVNLQPMEVQILVK
ncbi:MAG: alpha-amylase family glycosyl hydrolase [Desulfocapsaceae bacterium]|nr:alpha-amylase family glycosyl hydrolase [Desulfocapsaceae bacterium]